MIEEFMAKYSKTESHHKFYTYALKNRGTCLFGYDRGNTEIKDPWVYDTSGKYSECLDAGHESILIGYRNRPE
jgi:hypothetical protein